MPLPRTYKEIEEMVRRKVLTTKMARAIVRKAGFRPAITEAEALGTNGIGILSVSGAAVDLDGEPVPNPPWPS